MRKATPLSIALICLLALMGPADGAPVRKAKELPEPERALANTVDPWGVPFSDSLRRWDDAFAGRPEALFAAGVTHDLVKIWPTKYWFRGQTFLSGLKPGRPGAAREVWAPAGSTQAFQVAALPGMGAAEGKFTLTVVAEGLDVRVFRQVFVKCPPAAYPRLGSDRWPDPLLPESSASASEMDLAAFWVDLGIPAGHPGGTVLCQATMAGRIGDRSETAEITFPLRIVPGLDLEPKEGLKLTAWFRSSWPDRTKMPPELFDQMRELVLSHHLLPSKALDRVWVKEKPEAFDKAYESFREKGQRFFHLSKMTPELYKHLKEKGILHEFATYGVDEPSPEILRERAIPRYQKLKSDYPDLRVYMATEPWPEIGKACDFFLTDLSSHLYDPRTYKHQDHPKLWHYYCHLPIRWQSRAPLPMAPNMQIDNPALEHRIALWMSDHWGAEGVFIWSGNAWGAAKELWTTGLLSDKLSGFPYAGVHNGNGFLVAPGPENQSVLPTIRLKVLRAGMEDLALLRAARRSLEKGQTTGAERKQLAPLLDPVPGLFVHPHYFDRLPETLLGRREAILKLLAKDGGDRRPPADPASP